MKIDTCTFGLLVIDGKKYTSDLIIYPDGHVSDSWHRRDGHKLSQDDIDQLIASCPEVIIAGTGMDGRVMPEKKLEELLGNKGIEFYSAPNGMAVELFNQHADKKRTGACFHLTC